MKRRIKILKDMRSAVFLIAALALACEILLRATVHGLPREFHLGLIALALVSLGILFYLRVRRDRLHKDLQDEFETLTEDRNYLMNVVDNLPVALFCKDAQEGFNFILWNRHSEELFGLSREQVLGKNDYDLFPKKQADFFREKDKETLHAGRNVTIPEEPVLSPNKGERWVKTIKVPLKDIHGRPRFLVGISQDMTDARSATKALRESETLVQELGNNIPGVLFSAELTTTGQLQIIYLSRAAEELLGESQASLADVQVIISRTHPEDLLSLANAYQRSVNELKPFHWEGRWLRKDGVSMWVRAESRPYRTETGATRWDGVLLNISDLKSAESQIKLYEQVVREMSLGLYVYRLEEPGDASSFRIVAANPVSERFTGFKVEDTIGKKILDVFPNTHLLNDFLEVVKTGSVKDLGVINTEFPKPMGLQQFTIRAFAISADMLAVIFENVTERLKASRELEFERGKAIGAAKMASLGEMAGGIAHEINNPLAIIHGKAMQLRNAASRGDIKGEQVILVAEKIEQTAMRISKIIKGLRTFSRNADADPFTACSVPSIIDDTLELCRERFRSHDVEVRLESIPAIAIDCRAAQISQVLLNLLNNAFDAVRSLPERWIEISVVLGKNDLSIIVTDSGQGIPPAIAEKIMEPFFTTKEVGKGTGLGLSIAKGIVEDHGGTLTLDAGHPNTRFIVKLPYKQAS